MHTSAMHSLNLRGTYIPLEVEEDSLSELLPALHALGFLGLNVTAPLKEAVLPHLSEISPLAKKIGAVNTLLFTSQGFKGFNTDASGFQDAYLRKRTHPSRALIVGAGGAARAILYALIEKGFSPVVTARDPEKGQKLAQEFQGEFLTFDELKEPFPLIVNTTGVSTATEFGKKFKPKLTERGEAVDINYFRKEYLLEKLATQVGGQFYDGKHMLVCQARLSFIQWTNRTRVSRTSFYNGLDSFRETIKHSSHKNKGH
jgi:shikimate dehydrogenase